MEQQLPPGYAEVQQINDILMQPSTAGSRLLDLISALRTARPRYRLTPHCLYLAIHVAMQSRSAEDTHKLLLEFLKNGREGLPADLCHALPATLLKAAETFISNGDLIWAMSVFDAMQRLDVLPEERTVTMFLQRAQYVVELKKEHPKFGLNLLSFGRKLVLTVARESSSNARKKEGGATNLEALLAQLERSVLPQLSKRQPFGSCNAFGRPKSCNWEKLGAVRIRHG